MMIGMLVAGIGCLLAGLLAIGFGIPVQEFSFGNTLILSGVVTACTGLIILALWVVLGELKNIAQRLGSGVPLDLAGATATRTAPRSQAPDSGFSFNQPAPEDAGHIEADAPPAASAPWLEEAVARTRAEAAPPPPPPPPAPESAEPAPKPRRNLLFSSSSRKERERAQTRTADPVSTGLFPAPDAGAPPPSVAESNEPPAATFDDAWPKSERARGADAPPRRPVRTPSTFTEAAAIPDRPSPPPRAEEQPPVTVLKSGVVDGMAYSLYSDGSIEAQMPEGMMRFASIDELRSHLDQRP